MELPFFYLADIPSAANELVLPEESSKHIVSVLRMQEGDELQLTNGQGTIVRAYIQIAHKKNCTLKTIEVLQSVDSRRPVTLAISLLKNPSRFEWMLEKVTEIGIRTVVPLISQRTERQRFRADRMKNIMVSAMLQSQQSWLPEMMEPISFSEVLKMGDFEKKIYCPLPAGEKIITKGGNKQKRIIHYLNWSGRRFLTNGDQCCD